MSCSFLSFFLLGLRRHHWSSPTFLREFVKRKPHQKKTHPRSQYMLLNCPEKNTYTRPKAPAKIRPFPSCPRGDSGDKGKSKRAGKKKNARLDFPLPPLSAPGYARMFWSARLGAKLLMACEQPLCSGKGVKKSRGERRERVRACRQTFFRGHLRWFKRLQLPESQNFREQRKNKYEFMSSEGHS